MLKHARKVTGEGLARQYSLSLTSIDALDSDDSTRAAARGLTFACPGCERIVVPVFFAVSKVGARHAEQSHFRLKGVEGEPRPMRHMPRCRYYVEPVVSHGRATGSAPGTSSRRLAPSVFVDEPELDPVRSGGTSAPNGVSGLDSSTRSRGSHRSTPGTRIAESRVNDISALAGPFHHRQSVLDTEPLALAGCPATTYGRVFRRIDASLTKVPPKADQRFIYWFQPQQIEQWGPNFGFPLGLRTAEGSELYVYIKSVLAGESLPDSFVSAIRRLKAGKPMTVYVLGAFAYSARLRQFRLEPLSTRHVHVELGPPSG